MGPDTPEFFLTARNSVGTFRIAWSFYAAAMGSWTLFSPAQYAWTAGQALPPCKAVSEALHTVPIMALYAHVAANMADLLCSLHGAALHATNGLPMKICTCQHRCERFAGDGLLSCMRAREACMRCSLMGAASCAGWFGLMFYALASGLPILIQGFLGPVVQRRKPNLLSFTDFVAQVYCAAFPSQPVVIYLSTW